MPNENKKMHEIVVPALGESIQEGTIATIYKKAGESVSVDEVIADIETDKVGLEIVSPVSGVVSEIKCSEDDNVKVGQLIILVQEGGVAQSASASASASASDVVVKGSNSLFPAKEAVIKQEKHLSPAPRKLANDLAIDVSNIQGTGKDQRVTKGDILQATNNISGFKDVSTQQDVKMDNVEMGNFPKEEVVKMSRLRKTIAKRLKESQNTAAILTTFNEIDMTNVMQFRKKYKEIFEKKHEIKLGFSSFFIKATVQALKEIPAVNAEIRGDNIVYKNYYNISVAVGTDKGLVVPVVKNADRLTFAAIESEIMKLATKARKGNLSMEDLMGGTFSITNGGVYGSLISTPIINPPQSAIFGMHAIKKRAMVMSDNTIVARDMMYVALSYDHRIVDGKEAVTFLVRIKELIEDPGRLILDV